MIFKSLVERALSEGAEPPVPVRDITNGVVELEDDFTVFHGTSSGKAYRFLEDGMDRPKGKVGGYADKVMAQFLRRFQIQDSDGSLLTMLKNDHLLNYRVPTRAEYSGVDHEESSLYFTMDLNEARIYAEKARWWGSELYHSCAEEFSRHFSKNGISDGKLRRDQVPDELAKLGTSDVEALLTRNVGEYPAVIVATLPWTWLISHDLQRIGHSLDLPEKNEKYVMEYFVSRFLKRNGALPTYPELFKEVSNHFISKYFEFRVERDIPPSMLREL